MTSDSDLILRHLKRFSTANQILSLAFKLLTKAPELYEELYLHVSQVAKKYQLHESRAFLANIISDALKAGSRHRLPNHVGAYLAYMDLCWMGEGTPNNNTKWVTFKLNGFQVSPMLYFILFTITRHDTHLSLFL